MGRRGRRRTRTRGAEVAPSTPPSDAPTPWWGRVIAAVVVVAAVAGAVLVLIDLDTGDRTSWAKHLAGALALLFVPAGIAGIFLSERVTRWVLVTVGWMLPIVLVWLGVEHWVNWFAFYNPTHGRARITTQTGARIQGSFVIALGAIAAWVWTLLLRGDRRKGNRGGG